MRIFLMGILLALTGASCATLDHVGETPVPSCAKEIERLSEKPTDYRPIYNCRKSDPCECAQLLWPLREQPLATWMFTHNEHLYRLTGRKR